MNVHIPIADVTLTDGQTYSRQLPVWPSRPLMVKVTTGTNEPVNITVRNNGSPVKTITLPYQQYGVDIDLSFAAPLLDRADRDKSQGTPWFMPQEILFWVDDPTNYITIPVFHCDLTYWYTLGVDSALPQPIKPRIPGQTLDIFFPYIIHPSDAFQVQAEPVEGAPSSAILPNTYVLGDTMDITYVKKLTIKNVWGNGLDQVINYEDRLMSDVVYDEGLQCALRARWNMRNGQWFWAAFKDYFWSNKFTAIRGKGGVTEQAEITVNLEYGEEWYAVYQELLVSSNIIFDLNIEGINQYQDKRFRAEVSGDTGARWSNSTKTYRQQVRFKTTELQDNYMFPTVPDTPPTPSIAFSAQFNPWTVSPNRQENLGLQVYSNAAYYIESEPSWLAVTNGTTLLTPGMFEQGSALATPGLTWEQAKTVSPRGVRLKEPFTNLNEVYSVISSVPGLRWVFVYLDENGRITRNFNRDILGRSNTESVPQVALIITKVSGENITPAEVANIGAHWGKRYVTISAGTIYLLNSVQANPGEARTGTLSLRSMAGEVSYPITINQQKASISLSPTSVLVGNGVHTGYKITDVTANTDWEIVPGYAPWVNVTSYSGAMGTSQVFADITTNEGTPRQTAITFRSKVNPSVTATLTITQAGATGNISVTPNTANVSGNGGTQVVKVTSFGTWNVRSKPDWATVSPNTGPSGDTNVTITVAANTTGAERTSYVQFYNQLTGDTIDFDITQGVQAKHLRPEKEYVLQDISQTSGKIIPLDTNLELSQMEIEYAASWYIPEIEQVGSAFQVRVRINANTDDVARTGVFGIKDKVNNKTYPVFVIQTGRSSAPYIQGTPIVSVERQFDEIDPLELPRNAKTYKTCALTNTGGMNVTAIPNWVTMKRTELEKTGNLLLEMWEIQVAANTGSSRRTANISVDGTGIGIYLSLSQTNAGSYYDVENGNTQSFGKAGGVASKDLYTNISNTSGFRAILDDPGVNWLTASIGGESPYMYVTFNVQGNTTGASRKALVWITNTGSSDYPVYVIQNGA